MKRFLIRLLLSVVVLWGFTALIKSQITPQASQEMQTLERLTRDFYQPGKIEVYQTSWNVNHTKLCGSLD
ncbi:hypothetical protein EHF33_04885 [Deinococcus psychrotolerans]|uniref:Uncharacterized protein n=1 Tax=Deinococcus psychrotolerans TaxID=2489213 RepID=A0A3G8Y9Y6_9DEIO|nr:hypothetical protein [Deinococcus psychrotolerans]AZI42162.1 hypothetical protein EHF33_04885 [Deinococcus psychrotolerans]